MSFISKVKQFIGINDSQAGQFYPLLNSSYSDTHLSQSDYTRLYTGWVYLAVSTIANTVAWLEWSLTRNADSTNEIEHKHRPLITSSLLNKVVSYVQLNGSCYLYKSMIGARVDELRVLRTDMVNPQEDISGNVMYYDYTVGWKNYRFMPEELIDISLFNPYAWYPRTLKGISPTAAVAMTMETDIVSKKWNWNIFRNGAMVSQVIKAKDPVPQEAKQRAIADWKDNFWGVNNAHKMAFLDNGTEIEVIQANKKELDFVESGKAIRDEVLAMFKVPQAIVGISWDVSLANAQVARETYYWECIRPLCRLIEEQFNKDLFPWHSFRFVNYMPKDNQQLSTDYMMWAITINEYRKERWYAPIKSGDITINQTQSEPIKDTSKGKYDDIITKWFRKHIKGTKEYDDAREEENEKQRSQKVARLQSIEDRFTNQVNFIFNEQRKDAINKVEKKWLFSKLKYATLRNSLITPLVNEVMQKEGTEAYKMIWVDKLFRVWENNIQEYIKEQVNLMSNSVDKTTTDKIDKIVTDANNQWLWSEEIAQQIDKAFNDFTLTRSRQIARTTITTSANQASIEARDESGVVSGKEWYTARDERVCPQCWPMQGKVLGLKDNYFNKWDEYNKLKLDYQDVKWPALHPSCRCTLLPVI